MNREKTSNRRGKGPKGEADRRFRAIAEGAKLYRGRCLFPADGNGGLCLEFPSRRHVIPRSSVLNALKDRKSGKIIDFDWAETVTDRFVTSTCWDVADDRFDLAADMNDVL